MWIARHQRWGSNGWFPWTYLCKKDPQEELKLVLLYPLQVNGVVIARPFFCVEVACGQKKHVPEDSGFRFKRISRDFEQIILYQIFLSISMTRKIGEERTVREM